jgi:hypothetical protein
MHSSIRDSYVSMRLSLVMQGVSKKSFAMVFQMLLCGELRKGLYLKAYKLSILQHLEQSLVYEPLSVNVFIILVTQLTFGITL